MNMKTQSGLSEVHAWAFSITFAELIYNSIFRLLRNELRMVENRSVEYAVYRQRVLYTQIIFPVNFFYLFVKRLLVLHLEFSNRHQDAQSGTQAEVAFVNQPQVAGKAHGTVMQFYISGA